MKTLGVISDTHGLLREVAVASLAGSDAIVHAGDVGKPEVLSALREIAPLTAIRGNVDRWAGELPDTAVLRFAGHAIYVIHDLNALDFDPAASGIDIVIAGHSHRPLIREDGGVLYLNPGSAGPRRFRLPVGLATVTFAGGKPQARLIEFDV